MGLKIEYEPNDVCVMRFSGVLKQSEFAAEQGTIARQIDGGSKPRLLVVAENFEGWERGADWNDLGPNAQLGYYAQARLAEQQGDSE